MGWTTTNYTAIEENAVFTIAGPRVVSPASNLERLIKPVSFALLPLGCRLLTYSYSPKGLYAVFLYNPNLNSQSE